MTSVLCRSLRFYSYPTGYAPLESSYRFSRRKIEQIVATHRDPGHKSTQYLPASETKPEASNIELSQFVQIFNQSPSTKVVFKSESRKLKTDYPP